eukprot:423084_1
MGSRLSKATALIICAYIVPPLYSQSSSPILAGRPSSAFSTNSQFSGKDDQYCQVGDVMYQNTEWDEDTCWCTIEDACSSTAYMEADSSYKVMGFVAMRMERPGMGFVL